MVLQIYIYIYMYIYIYIYIYHLKNSLPYRHGNLGSKTCSYKKTLAPVLPTSHTFGSEPALSKIYKIRKCIFLEEFHPYPVLVRRC